MGALAFFHPTFRQVGLLLLLIGALFAAIGGIWLARQWWFIRHAALAGGVITALDERESASTDDTSTLYYPVVRFQTATGQEIVSQSTTGSRPTPFHVGQAVTIYYDPANPADARIQSAFQLFGIGAAFMLFGILFVLIGGALLVVQRLIDRVVT